MKHDGYHMRREAAKVGETAMMKQLIDLGMPMEQEGAEGFYRTRALALVICEV